MCTSTVCSNRTKKTALATANKRTRYSTGQNYGYLCSMKHDINIYPRPKEESCVPVPVSSNRTKKTTLTIANKWTRNVYKGYSRLTSKCCCVSHLTFVSVCVRLLQNGASFGMLVEQEKDALGALFPLLEISDSVTIDESGERTLVFCIPDVIIIFS